VMVTISKRRLHGIGK